MDTALNSAGLCGIATNERALSKVIALPDPITGAIKVLKDVSLSNGKKNKLIYAHETELSAISVNPDGTLIASASCDVPVIKIHSSDGSGEALWTLRCSRGSLTIKDIVFHPTLHLIASTSNKKMIRLFALKGAI